jgi:hypothetical protein
MRERKEEEVGCKGVCDISMISRPFTNAHQVQKSVPALVSLQLAEYSRRLTSRMSTLGNVTRTQPIDKRLLSAHVPE